MLYMKRYVPAPRDVTVVPTPQNGNYNPLPLGRDVSAPIFLDRRACAGHDTRRKRRHCMRDVSAQVA